MNEQQTNQQFDISQVSMHVIIIMLIVGVLSNVIGIMIASRLSR